MKKMLHLLCLLAATHLYSCNTKSDKAGVQDKDYLIDMTGLDSLKLGMSKADLEALLNTKFTLRHIKVDNGPYDTFNTKYKDVDLTIYLYEGDDESIATLYGIQSTDPSCKTAAGIGMGTEKAKVIDAYTNHKKYIYPEYETYPVRSKTKSVIAVMDTLESKALLFHIVNRKVSSIELSSYFEFD